MTRNKRMANHVRVSSCRGIEQFFADFTAYCASEGQDVRSPVTPTYCHCGLLRTDDPARAECDACWQGAVA